MCVCVCMCLEVPLGTVNGSSRPSVNSSFLLVEDMVCYCDGGSVIVVEGY